MLAALSFLAAVGFSGAGFEVAGFSVLAGLPDDFAEGAADFVGPLVPDGAFCWATTGQMRQPSEIASGATERPQPDRVRRDETGRFCMVASILAW